MITKGKILSGIKNRIVRFVTDPNAESGTVCQIGDSWFYFGGSKAEQMAPKDYVTNVPMSNIVDEVYDVLKDFMAEGEEFKDEYNYYDAVLAEHNNHNE